MPSLKTGTFILEAECATIAWTGAAVFLALRAFGDCLIALRSAQLSETRSNAWLSTHLDVSFATQSTTSTMRYPHHGRSQESQSNIMVQTSGAQILRIGESK